MSQSALTSGVDHSRVCVRLAKLQPDVRKPPLKLLRQPRTCGKAANEERELFMGGQKMLSRWARHTNRVSSEALAEVSRDCVYRGLDRGFEALRYLCSGSGKV